MFSGKWGYVINCFNVHFLPFFFFLLLTLFAVCFMFILDYGNDVRQKENLSGFLIQDQNES